MKIVTGAMLAVTLAAAPVETRAEAAKSEADRDKEVRVEVIARCRRDMGDYGAMMVKSCVDMDMEAYKDLKGYPKKYQAILDRCKRDMKSHGWMMVKSCADMDIEAEEALDGY